jgi:hypothetical protein
MEGIPIPIAKFPGKTSPSTIPYIIMCLLILSIIALSVVVTLSTAAPEE